MTTFADAVFQFGGMSVTPGIPVPFTGKWIWCDPLNGSDGNSGSTPTQAVATLYAAHYRATSGNNDVVVLIGNGGTTATARLSLANAQLWDSTATAGTLVWSKSATHLIGVTAPTQAWQRARIAPPTGVYTQSTFGSGNFVSAEV